MERAESANAVEEDEDEDKDEDWPTEVSRPGLTELPGTSRIVATAAGSSSG